MYITYEQKKNKCSTKSKKEFDIEGKKCCFFQNEIT